MSYKWAITKDYSPQVGAAPGTNGNAEGLEGPRHGRSNTPAQELPDMFRMLDDDGTLVYAGRCNCLTTTDLNVDGFEPLDDFGMPNAGCTSIEYFENGEWRAL